MLVHLSSKNTWHYIFSSLLSLSVNYCVLLFVLCLYNICLFPPTTSFINFCFDFSVWSTFSIIYVSTARHIYLQHCNLEAGGQTILPIQNIRKRASNKCTNSSCIPFVEDQIRLSTSYSYNSFHLLLLNWQKLITR